MTEQTTPANADEAGPKMGNDAPLTVGESLRLAAERAADLLAELYYANSDMRSAKLGVLPDGTPVEDMLAALKEEQAENVRLRTAMRQIKHQASRKALVRAEAMARIREIVDAF